MTIHHKVALNVLVLFLFHLEPANADTYKEHTICDNLNGTCWDFVIDNQTENSSQKTWTATLAWIDTLNNGNGETGPYNGYSDWHLPFSDDLHLDKISNELKFNNNIYSELGYLFYSELLNESDLFFFEDVTYWMGAAEWNESSTNWTTSDQLLSVNIPVNAEYNFAWRFDFSYGVHFLGDDSSKDIHAVAIRSYTVPEPSSRLLLLLGIGLLTYTMRNKRSVP